LYSCVTTPEMRAAVELAEHIRRGDLGRDGIFSLRDVYRRQWSGLDTPEVAASAVRVLTDWDWIRSAPDQDRKLGRPAAYYLINPKTRRNRDGSELA
jgi:hypothetical protein